MVAKRKLYNLNKSEIQKGKFYNGKKEKKHKFVVVDRTSPAGFPHPLRNRWEFPNVLNTVIIIDKSSKRIQERRN